MIPIRFDVNNAELQRVFLSREWMEVIDNLNEQIQPQSGKMTARHVVERLVWTFEMSRGEGAPYRELLEPVRDRIKRSSMTTEKLRGPFGT